MLYFSKCERGFEPNFQKLYMSIHSAYSANVIDTTDVVQQMQECKL